MSSISLCALALTGSLVAMLMLNEQKVYGKLIGLMVCTMISMVLLSRTRLFFNYLIQLGNRAHVESLYVEILIKMAGITLLTEGTADICMQAENPVCAKQVKVFGRFCILSAGYPLLTELVEIMEEMMR
ncbi:stage III sporulation protein AD [Lachnospiraceae bacterium XBB1006]|nr:stage III sporulation protein AD [Lachnospiraceae bacterium XBB1006]